MRGGVDTRGLPVDGEPGRAALRAYSRFRLQAHRATSDVLAGAYPFLADAGLPADGVLIGQDAWSGASFCFDPWVLYQVGVITNPNCVLAGAVGSGKSALAKSLATRSIAFGRRVYVPGDPKGEWSAVARAVGGRAIELGHGLRTRLNPLDAGPASAATPGPGVQDRTRTRRRDLLLAVARIALGRDLAPVEITALFAALDASVREHSTPVLPHVVDAMFAPRQEVDGSTIGQLTDDGRPVAHAVNRLVTGDLAGLFDAPSTTRVDASLPMLSLDLSRIGDRDDLLALVMTCASAWLEAALADPAAGQRWVIYDEAWRLMRQPALLVRMQAQWKLARALGVANLMVIHRLSDLAAVGEADSQSRNLAAGLLADCATKILYTQQHAQARLAAESLGLSSTQASQLPTLGRGEGLWRVGERGFLVRHLCTPGELEVFDTDGRMRGRTGAPDAVPSEA